MDTLVTLLVVGVVLGGVGAMAGLFVGAFMKGRFQDASTRRRDRRHRPLN
jgi:hypothetical protein